VNRRPFSAGCPGMAGQREMAGEGLRLANPTLKWRCDVDGILVWFL